MIAPAKPVRRKTTPPSWHKEFVAMMPVIENHARIAFRYLGREARQVADVRVHRETKRRPIDLHAEELPYLIPLPEKPYDTAEVVYRTVNAEGMVAYRQNFYSVPWR